MNRYVMGIILEVVALINMLAVLYMSYNYTPDKLPYMISDVMLAIILHMSALSLDKDGQ